MKLSVQNEADNFVCIHSIRLIRFDAWLPQNDSKRPGREEFQCLREVQTVRRVQIGQFVQFRFLCNLN